MPNKTNKPQPQPPPLLEAIQSPADLRGLSGEQLTALAEEIRQLIIRTVGRNGGHLASNLGIVELSLALHVVFDFTRDRLLWDVGHQCYAHKIVTGRRQRFETLRQAGGISGFPAPHESEYDLFYTGHAGTAISTATGLALGDQLAGQGERRVVAVVGDASIVNGLAMEGINNAGLLRRQFLVVLNDNSMAIDVTQGALARVLDRLRLTQAYSELKSKTQAMLRRFPGGPGLSEALRHIHEGLRTTAHGARLFESLGFRYFGPVDGHDLAGLIEILRLLADVPEPVLLHVHTQKGRGCDYAVEDPCRFHSPSAHTVNGGVVEFAKPARSTWTDAFSRLLLARGRQRAELVAITAAMPDGTGLAAFRRELPQRCLDVGISESHAVAASAGLAKAGLRPVVAIYSTFLQRAFDQVFEELCLQKLPVILCLDRAGLVGSDGAVHHGFADIAFLRPLPNMVLMAPADEQELASALDLALSLDVPCAIRYPRDQVPAPLPGAERPYELGKACLLRAGADASILALGAMAEHALAAADELARRHGIEAAVYSARFAKPVDEALLARLLAEGKPILTVEDHAALGGFGSAVVESAARGTDGSRSTGSLPVGITGILPVSTTGVPPVAATAGTAVGHTPEPGVLRNVPIRVLGIPDRFIAHASRDQQLAEAGLDEAGIVRAVLDVVPRDPARR